MGREKGFVFYGNTQEAFMETHKKGASFSLCCTSSYKRRLCAVYNFVFLSFNDRFLSIGSMRVDVLLIINQGIVYACLLSFRI